MGNTEEFLKELTELSLKYQIGLTDEPVLFEMTIEDQAREYVIDKNSLLSFE